MRLSTRGFSAGVWGIGHLMHRVSAPWWSLMWGRGPPKTLHMASFIFLERMYIVSSKFTEGLTTEHAPRRSSCLGPADVWGVWGRLWPDGSGRRGHGSGALVWVLL